MLSYTVPTAINQRRPHRNHVDEVTALEKRFPRIASELCMLWKTPEIEHYIDSLLLDDRGDRMGFPIDVLDELMFLAGIRWHQSHLCGTLIETTTTEEFSYKGNRTELCNSNSNSWVLV